MLTQLIGNYFTSMAMVAFSMVFIEMVMILYDFIINRTGFLSITMDIQGDHKTDMIS